MKDITFQTLSKLIRELEFYPLTISNWIDSPVIKTESKTRNFRPDFLVDIGWENNSYKFLVEVKTNATPKVADNAIYQLKQYISSWQNEEKINPLLIAPYLSEKRLADLIEEKISGLDLSGNGVIYIPGKIFIYRSGAENKFPSNAPIKNVFRGVSSLVGRVFFAKQEYGTVGEVLDEIKERSGDTTFGTVSKVLKALEEELIISRNEGIRLIDGRRLLQNLRDDYRRPKISRTVKGISVDLEDAVAEMSENANKADVLFAINEPERYAVLPTSGMAKKIYTEDIDMVLREVEFSDDERFPNVELIETQEKTVYFDRVYDLAKGSYFTSPVQVYLELATGGKREKDTSEQIAKNILNFEYQ